MEALALPFIAAVLGLMIGCIRKMVTRFALLVIALAMPGLWYFAVAVSVHARGGEEGGLPYLFGIPLAAVWAIVVAVSFLVARSRRQRSA
jgi:hypothetical protein